MAKVTRDALSKSNAKGIKGNMKGDGMQTGGMLIVTQGGDKILLSHQQSSPGDHVANATILNALGISEASGGAGPSAQPAMECSEDACSLPTDSKPKMECNEDACSMPNN
ncbi:predicted protein [Nematostella vectensis]|uniref:Uncharacterized protein n=2 Tax=Nematostella vectensis TaxID=45351 RepID=A7SSB0_NEMVE|nr:predicted protein [Nematostella vectensis]|eukprot:XP_001625526.1 predicted protein [Nematostella vectensis]